jgi:hypothetical protein
MIPAAEPVRRPLLAATLLVLSTAAFACACGQAPLYYSNQNQYFLHGLAAAGDGELRHDWLAETRDPTPLFSGLVAVTVRWLHPWAFYVYYALLMGVYAVSLFAVFAAIVGKETAARRWPLFVALFVLAHAALPRWLSYRWFGQDYPWFLQAGVAGQYLLGAMFQPSSFGVLLVAAVALFVHGRPFLASACAALGASVHSTYLLPAGLLTLGFLTALCVEGRFWRAVALGAWALVLVLPVAVFVLVVFGPTSPEKFDEAQKILYDFRIPHHCRPDLWLDVVAWLQIGWVALAVALAWRTRLFFVLAVPFVLAALLTLAQVVTGSRTLALLFPWRVSAVLVPVATTVILARLAALPFLRLEGRIAGAASVVVVLGLAAAGLWICFARQGYHSGEVERPLLEQIRKNSHEGELYFVWVTLPSKPTRGSLSSDFEPLADKQRDPRVIPPSLQGFRLTTGAPIYVDFKSIPYKDVEVLDWRARLDKAQRIQTEIREGRLSEALDKLRRLHVTHLVLPAGQKVSSEGVEEVPGPEEAPDRVYRLKPAEE